jgi:hypothetical protein
MRNKLSEVSRLLAVPQGQTTTNLAIVLIAAFSLRKEIIILRYGCDFICISEA